MVSKSYFISDKEGAKLGEFPVKNIQNMCLIIQVKTQSLLWYRMPMNFYYDQKIIKATW